MFLYSLTPVSPSHLSLICLTINTNKKSQNLSRLYLLVNQFNVWIFGLKVVILIKVLIVNKFYKAEYFHSLNVSITEPIVKMSLVSFNGYIYFTEGRKQEQDSQHLALVPY